MTREGGTSSTDKWGGTDERGGTDEQGGTDEWSGTDEWDITNEGVTNEARKRRGKVLDGKPNF